MKNYLSNFIVFIFTIILGTSAYADGHENPLNEAFNLQVQLCKLKDGATLAQYNAMNKDYIKWSKENDVEVTYVRQTPLFSHADFNQSPGYDFIELLASSFGGSGKGWDKWLGTKNGQKLNEKWNELATCHVKMARGRMIAGDTEALDNTNERVVTWNWCSINDGVEVADVISRHAELAKSFEEDSQGAIGWFGLIPTIGGANTPGDFAHVVVYPDFESAMKRQKSLADGGWKGYRDYQENYASCSGESLLVEEILHRPGQ